MQWNASLAAFAALLLIGCGGRAEAPLSSSAFAGERYGAYQAVGQASWYGDELRGSRTASGAKFDPRAITVAHRTLPLGSFVEITAMNTGRSIIALVNDRGPGRKDRIVDLSHGAAQLLGTGGQSVSTVRLRAITPTDADAAALRGGNKPAERSVTALNLTQPSAVVPLLDRNGDYIVQVATFSNQARARALADSIKGNVVQVGDLWKVQSRRYEGADAVQRARDAMIARGYGDATIISAN